MPLYDNADNAIRELLRRIARGERVQLIPVGCLTSAQHDAINHALARANLPGLDNPEILLLGRHMYRSRVTRDCYSIEDVIRQVRAALASTSVVHRSSSMTTLTSTVKRADGYGANVVDTAILELTARKPKAELFSVVPKGDIPPCRLEPRKEEMKRPLESGLEA